MSQTESGVAEQMVGMSIRAMESLSRLLASGAKNLAVFLFSVAKGTKQYRGITSVKQLLDGGHELVTLELNKNVLREFCVHAKKNDIPCTVIHDKKLYQDTVPVLVRKTNGTRASRRLRAYLQSSSHKKMGTHIYSASRIIRKILRAPTK